MTAATKVQTLYVELRQLLGGSVTSREALAFASSIVKFYLARRRQTRLESRGYPNDEIASTAFECLPVDAAMRDGGWKILEYEIDQFRPEIEVGRVQMYEISSEVTRRIYAAEGAIVDTESDRLMRSLEWLLDRKGIERRHVAEDNYGTANDE